MDYDQGTADYAVETIKDDGLVANGPDGVDRQVRHGPCQRPDREGDPVYTAQDSPPKEGLTAEDIVTNQFLDESIGLESTRRESPDHN